MRQFGHKVIALAFWALLIWLWVQLVLDGKAGRANIAYSIQYLSVVVGAVLAVTGWWIHHNTRIYQRKGPRTGRPELPPRLDEDRLGRALRWELDDGPAGARLAAHLLVEIDGETKIYRELG